MNRTERKCLLASATLHGLLVMVLLLAPAFLSSRPKEMKTAADFISAGAVEAALGGRSGGAPMVAPAPTPPAPQVQAPPQPKPPKAEPEPEPEPEPENAPATRPVISKNALEPKPEAKRQYELKPATTAKTSSTKKAAPEKKYVLKIAAPSTAKNSSSGSTKSSSAVASANDAQKKWAETVGSLAKRLGKSGSGGVDIPVPGEGGGGGGGSGLGDYASLVKAVYDNAWVDPSDVSDESASVKVVIVIARSGAIVSAKISSRSGVSSLDASVQKALDHVTRIPQPFPPEIRDSQISFTINFNLGNRRRLG